MRCPLFWRSHLLANLHFKFNEKQVRFARTLGCKQPFRQRKFRSAQQSYEAVRLISVCAYGGGPMGEQLSALKKGAWQAIAHLALSNLRMFYAFALNEVASTLCPSSLLKDSKLPMNVLCVLADAFQKRRGRAPRRHARTSN